jgi:hypothetical protein
MCWFDTCVGDRKAVLWLDMFSARRAGFLTSDSISEFSQALGLGNVNVELVPPSHADTHRSQKQAVTAIWKTLYRKYWIQHVLDQLSARRNPLTTMNVRKAVAWATSAWNTDLGPQSIQTHFGRSSWLPGLSRKDPVYDDAHLREAKQYLQNAIRVLKQSSFIHKAMDIDAFINPPFESSENAWIDEEHIALGSNGSAVPEGDSDEEVE